MALLTGFNKIKTAVFISGTGSNLKSLIQFSKLKKSPIVIEMIISIMLNQKAYNMQRFTKLKKKYLILKTILLKKKLSMN